MRPSRRRAEAFIRFVLTGNYGRRRPRPCRECPFRRRSVRGWLGPHTVRGFIDMIHGEGPLFCHMSIPDGYDRDEDEVPDTGVLLQCAGAAIFRANVYKTPRNPSAALGPVDRERVFASNEEFERHHTPVRIGVRRRR